MPIIMIKTRDTKMLTQCTSWYVMTYVKGRTDVARHAVCTRSINGILAADIVLATCALTLT